MNIFSSILEFLKTLITLWFIVEPWEQAVRVRFGKTVALFEAGIHFRIPFFDTVYKQNVRRRVSAIPLQTLTTQDGASITLHGSIGYRIADVLKLQSTLHNAEQSVQQEVLGLITKYVVTHPKAECRSEQIIEHLDKFLELDQYGLVDVDFFLTGYVCDIPTFRLIQDSMNNNTYQSDTLSTNAVLQVGASR